MDRKFMVVVSYNKDADGNKTGATWVTLFEVDPTNPEVSGHKFRPWYVDYIVRGEDVKKVVKNHVEFLKTFDVPKENIRIDDQRNNVTKPEANDRPVADTGQHGAQEAS